MARPASCRRMMLDAQGHRRAILSSDDYKHLESHVQTALSQSDGSCCLASSGSCPASQYDKSKSNHRLRLWEVRLFVASALGIVDSQYFPELFVRTSLRVQVGTSVRCVVLDILQQPASVLTGRHIQVIAQGSRCSHKDATWEKYIG